MDYTVLGRTGLKVSVMGLGCGGRSRAGLQTGKTEAESIALVRQACDAGINFVDTAEHYGTEEVVGKAIKNIDRSSLVLSTKVELVGKDIAEDVTPRAVQKALEASLNRLRTDYVDIYQFHGLRPRDYDYIVSDIVPSVQRMRQQGKIRFIGTTDVPGTEGGHAALERALQDDIWDVVLVGFNMLNQTARDRVFPKTIQKNAGTLIAFAVRTVFSRPERFKQRIQELIVKKELDPADIDESNPLGFLVHEGGAVSLQDAAYRFCRYEPGAHVILSGTGNPDHLKANIESFSRPPLPGEDVARIKHIFRNVHSVFD